MGRASVCRQRQPADGTDALDEPVLATNRALIAPDIARSPGRRRHRSSRCRAPSRRVRRLRSQAQWLVKTLCSLRCSYGYVGRRAMVGWRDGRSRHIMRWHAQRATEPCGGAKGGSAVLLRGMAPGTCQVPAPRMCNVSRSRSHLSAHSALRRCSAQRAPPRNTVPEPSRCPV